MNSVDLALEEFFHRLAHELNILAETGALIERSVCACIQSGRFDDQGVREMQALDHMLQHLAALRDFLVAAGGESTGEPRVNIVAALDQVPLAEVRARLAAAPGSAMAVPPPRRVELF
jgi:hypothetical protein